MSLPCIYITIQFLYAPSWDVLTEDPIVRTELYCAIAHRGVGVAIVLFGAEEEADIRLLNESTAVLLTLYGIWSMPIYGRLERDLGVYKTMLNTCKGVPSIGYVYVLIRIVSVFGGKSSLEK